MWRVLFYWFGAVALAGLPVVWVPTSAFNDVGLEAFANTAQVNYRDLTVFTMAVLGVAIFDAIEAAQLSRRADGLAAAASALFGVLLVLSFAACLISYGLTVAERVDLPSRLPGWVFISSLVVAFLAKLSVSIAANTASST